MKNKLFFMGMCGLLLVFTWTSFAQAIGTLTLKIKSEQGITTISGLMELTWIGTTTPATYTIYRKQYDGSPPSPGELYQFNIIGSTTATSYIDRMVSHGSQYFYGIEEKTITGTATSNIAGGYPDTTPPQNINDLKSTSQPQVTQIDINWTNPFDAFTADYPSYNGGQMYFKIYRATGTTSIAYNQLSNLTPIGLATATKPYLDTAKTTWSDRVYLQPATLYNYVVIPVDTAGVETIDGINFTRLWNIPNLDPMGNISSGISAGDKYAITPILDLQGKSTGVGTVSLTWTANTSSFGLGYYFMIYRGTFSQTGTLTTSQLIPANLIGTTTNTFYNDTSAVSGQRYSYAVIIYDPSTNEYSPLSNDCVVLADWTPPVVNIISPISPIYVGSPASVTVTFTYTELNPISYSVNIYGSAGNSIGSVSSSTIPETTGTIYATVSITGADGTYSVTVTMFDEGGNIGSNTQSGVVVIDTATPTVTVLEPTTNVYRQAGETVLVQFTYTEPNPATYTISITNGVNEIGSTTGSGLTSPNGMVTTTITLYGDASKDGKYTVTVTLKDKRDMSTSSSAPGLVVFDNTKPVVTVTAPATHLYRQTGQEVAVGFTFTEDNPDTFLIEVLSNGTVIGSKTDTLTNSPWTGTVTITERRDESIAYKIKVTITDKVGLVGTNTAPGTLTLDNTQPTVNITFPLGGAVYTKTPATITVTFTYVENNPGTVTVTIGTTTVIGIATGTPQSNLVQIANGFGTASVYIADTPADESYNVMVEIVDMVNLKDSDTEYGAVWVDNTLPLISYNKSW